MWFFEAMVMSFLWGRGTEKPHQRRSSGWPKGCPVGISEWMAMKKGAWDLLAAVTVEGDFMQPTLSYLDNKEK